MKAVGAVVTVGDDVDTDVIYPARYLAVLDPADQATRLFEPLGESFRARLVKSGVLVAGWNFGCGSSREHAVTSLKGAGVRVVIARSFSRIFFRNAINIGLPVVASAALADALKDGDRVEVDLARGEATMPDGRAIGFDRMPEELLAILSAGGLWAARAAATPRQERTDA